MTTPDDDTEVFITSEMGTFGLVPIWVMRFKDRNGKGLSGSDLRVYISLRSFADRTHRDVFPHVKTIAARADVHITTAHKSITRLRDMGLIESKRRYRADGSIARCDYKLFDIEPRGVLAISPVPPSGEASGSSPGDQSKKRPLEETTRREVKSSVHASGADGDDTSNPNMRDVDRVKLTDTLGDRFRSSGLIWTKGEFNTADFYKPLYEKLTQQRNGKPAWPGCFVEDLVNSNRFDDWLMEQGLEQVS